MRSGTLVFLILVVVGAAGLARGAEPDYTRTADVIYGRKFGTALTMDVFRPKANANGAAIVWIISGGWFSSHDLIPSKFGGRGYTMFAVVHGSQPRYAIPDAVRDVNRAIRFIRFHAAEYGIDPARIGISGGSAGGHLALMQGVKPAAPDEKSADLVERTSARVAAVACLFPPTDFLNYGAPGKIAWTTTLSWLPGAFDFQKTEQAVAENSFSLHFVPVEDQEKQQVAKEVSPIYWVTSQAPPTLIIHGDADQLVPIEQVQRFVAKLDDAKVPAKLEIKKGKGHGWPDTQPELNMIIDWFDQYLSKGTTRPATTRDSK